MSPAERIRRLLVQIYGPAVGAEVANRLLARVPQADPKRRRARPAGSDAILISYADSLRAPDEPPLVTLAGFVDRHLPEMSHVHLLPFFPSSGDDGFAVIDFEQVDPALGTWEDVTVFTRRRRLMVDLVLNHVSAKSEWFRRFLDGDPEYRRWFHVVPPGADLSGVFRPRAHPLLTTFQTAEGPVRVWTTFSADQVDLDFSHPPVLEKIIDILLGYVAKGASVIRFDAVGFVWKEPGTPSLHHPKTHAVVKLLRAVLDHTAPEVDIVTETNVPHPENIAYFGDGGDEAQMVYNFSLPPLVLDAFVRGDASVLTGWAAALDQPATATFVNFLASHDGIGLRPLEGLLPDEAIDDLARRVEAAGGRWSGRSVSGGGIRPYELNISYLDALGGPDPVARFLAAVSIQLALRGVPAVYIHSALGSESWWEGPDVTGHARSINRAKPWLAELETELADPGSRRSRVLTAHRLMLAARSTVDAFDPFGEQLILDRGPEVFSLVRSGETDAVWCLTNVTDTRVVVDPPPGWAGRRRSLLTDRIDEGPVKLGPYEYRWYVR